MQCMEILLGGWVVYTVDSVGRAVTCMCSATQYNCMMKQFCDVADVLMLVVPVVVQVEFTHVILWFKHGSSSAYI